MSDLRERVAQAIAGTIGLEHMPSGTRNMYLRNADAAIALVLEEAARVAEDYEGKGFELGLHTQSGDAYVTRSDIAAAIRARGKAQIISDAE